ncbi:Uncharacterised protein [Mycobacteroides abscessus subsp. massiliense]|nr:Uncharacterised protein [Mycobacteroides abscessus subsp. massiliense]
MLSAPDQYRETAGGAYLPYADRVRVTGCTGVNLLIGPPGFALASEIAGKSERISIPGQLRELLRVRQLGQLCGGHRTTRAHVMEHGTHPRGIDFP